MVEQELFPKKLDPHKPFPQLLHPQLLHPQLLHPQLLSQPQPPLSSPHPQFAAAKSLMLYPPNLVYTLSYAEREKVLLFTGDITRRVLL